MITAHSLAAVEVTLAGHHAETTPTNMALRAAGFTSILLRFVFPGNILKPDPEDDKAKPDARPKQTIVVAVGRAERDIEDIGGEVRKLQAFAVWAATPEAVHDLARAIGMENKLWRNYAAKASHLPMLEAPTPDGRWYVCYAPDDATLPGGITFADG